MLVVCEMVYWVSMDVMYVLVFIKCDSGFIDLFTDVTFQALKKENSFDDNKMFHVDDQFIRHCCKCIDRHMNWSIRLAKISRIVWLMSSYLNIALYVCKEQGWRSITFQDWDVLISKAEFQS